MARPTKGGNVQVGAEPGNLDSIKARFQMLDLDGSFAVIHDEPYLTIVWDSGEYRGTIVHPSLEKLEEARNVAGTYNLEIYHVRVDNHGNFDLRMREAHVCN